jgi:hypothetical protein
VPVSSWIPIIFWGGPVLVGTINFTFRELTNMSIGFRGRVALMTICWAGPLTLLLMGDSMHMIGSMSLGFGGRVVLRTMLWAGPLALLMGQSLNIIKPFKVPIPYDDYFRLRALVSILMIALGVFTLYHAARYKPDASHWKSSSLLLSLAIYWTLFPPMWFYTEYFAFDNDVIQLPSHLPTKKDFLSNYKEYAGLASPIWAGFLAILAGVLYNS